MQPPQKGDVLSGKYRVESVLGKGGMGFVVAATHLSLGQLVAIKFLYQPGNQESTARFLREARASVRLQSEHVARVLDVGELDNGAPYMVMEYLRGEDLSHYLSARGALPIPEAAGYILQTCEAIAEAHAAGIIHRDLKPANLFLAATPDGGRSVKVLDFGISKAAEGDMQLTQTDTVLGSPLYMSPEQLKSFKSVDARADIWALGVILYQLVTGKVPFNADVFSELVLRVYLEPPPPIASFRSDVPPALERAILKCLAKEQEARFQNVGELALAIADFGPETGRISAEKAARVLEAAGQTVRPPEGDGRGAPPAEMGVSAVTTAASQASWPPSPPLAGTGVAQARADHAAGPPTGMIAGSLTAVVEERPLAPDAAQRRLGLRLGVGLVAAALLAGGATMLVLRALAGPPKEALSTVSVGPEAPPTENPDPPKSSEAADPEPTATGSASEAAAPSGAPSASTNAAPPPVPTAARTGQRSSATSSPQAAPKPPKPSSNDPFSGASSLGNKY